MIKAMKRKLAGCLHFLIAMIFACTVVSAAGSDLKPQWDDTPNAAVTRETDTEAEEEPSEADTTRAYYILRAEYQPPAETAADDTEENEAEPKGAYVVSIYMTNMPALISGGSFGLRYSSALPTPAFASEFPCYEPLDTTGKPYHFFHFLEKEDGDSDVRVGIDAVGDKEVLLCTYTFELTAAQYRAMRITSATISQLKFDAIPETANMAQPVMRAAWAADKEGVYCYQGVLFDDEMGVDSTFPIYFKSELPDADGVSVSGKIQSYDPKKAAKVELINLDDPTVIYTEEIPAESTGKGAKVQDFTVTDVAPGRYQLRITKASHLAFIKQTVTVEGADVILTGLCTGAPDDTADVAVLLCGDIDQDGYIKFSDRNKLLSSRFYGKAVASFTGEEQAKAKLADLDGDGYVKMSDVNVIMSGRHYGKATVVIP